MYEYHHDIDNRGDYYPRGVASETAFKNIFAETGFWGDTKGTLLIVDESDAMLGQVQFFETVSYLDEIELSYMLYAPTKAGKGVVSEGVRLFTGYLFDTKRYNRIRLIIHPDNTASKRIAEKTGYTFEGVARGVWYHRARHHDCEVWSRLRADHLSGGVAGG